MIEILLGLLTLASSVVILMGAGDTLGLPVGDLFPLIGFRGTALIVLVGVLPIARARISPFSQDGARQALGASLGGADVDSVIPSRSCSASACRYSPSP